MNFIIISASLSGFYVDNGFDQTMIERIMTKEEKREVEYEILNMLGLPNRPRKKITAPLKKSAPRFLMDVYKTLMEDSNRHTRSTELNLSGEEQQAIDESDIIMTFESQSDRVSSVRHERGKRLWFNVSEVPVSENIVGAELRIYKNSNLTNFDPDDQFIVAAYQLIRTDNGERELEFVTSLNTTANYMGWIELNMTGPLSSWVAFPHSNKGLYLSVHPVDKPGHEIRPEDIGLVSAKGEDEKQPFMVAFLKAVNHVKVRARRDTRKKTEYSPANTIRSTYSESNYGSSRSCKIKNLYINFKDLKWQDWIIAPEGYAAFFCSGECKFPLNAHMNATNHAIVQTLVHLMKPNEVPKPCCAPTKLTPISVLYFLEDSNVILKKYKKMVVKSCGCH